MDNILQTVLAEAVNSLASFFGTTTEAIMEHAPEFLAKYGWYSTLNELPVMIVLSMLLAALICLIRFAIQMSGGYEFKHTTLINVGIFIFCIVSVVGIKIITCMVSPEIVGLHAIMELFST